MNHTIALLDLRLRRRAIIGYALGLGVVRVRDRRAVPVVQERHQPGPARPVQLHPDGRLRRQRVADLPDGWLNANLFNNFVPLILIVLTVGYGAWCVAGQDETGTLSLTATLPTTRGRMIAGQVLRAGRPGLSRRAGHLPVRPGRSRIRPAGRRRGVGRHLSGNAPAGHRFRRARHVARRADRQSRHRAERASAVAAAAAYLISSLAPAISWLHPFRFASPFYWALGNDPLQNGLPTRLRNRPWWDGGALLGAAAVALRRLDLH